MWGVGGDQNHPLGKKARLRMPGMSLELPRRGCHPIQLARVAPSFSPPKNNRAS
jgi:hypothetical protein